MLYIVLNGGILFVCVLFASLTIWGFFFKELMDEQTVDFDINLFIHMI